MIIMTFRETLEKHLRAIRERDLRSLVETLPDETLTLIMSDGRLVRTVREFVDLHRDWFGQATWSLETEVVAWEETAQMGHATIHLDYRDESPGGGRTHQASYLTLIFALRDGKWEMTLDQNTPIKGRG
jgi:hypothetical protein